MADDPAAQERMPDSALDVDLDKPGIKGWLAFFSLGVFLVPFIFAWQYIQAFVEEFQKATGHGPSLSVIHQVALRSMEDWTLAASLGVFLGVEAVAVWLLVRWRQRKKEFPRYWSVFLLCMIPINVAGAVLAGETIAKSLSPRDVLTTIIAVAYWNRSRRVKATFVR
jgi:hypothetical protein